MSKVRRYRSSRKYRCPYCEKTATRDKLAVHVEEKHAAELPEGYSGARAVYDYLNKKNYGTCLICKTKVYEWDDKTSRYKNICNNPRCLAVLRERAGHNHLENPEVQKKLLEGRKISGKYTFSDGVTHSYVGSYERNCFEFMDKVMNIPGKDIMSPGPVIMYEYEGETHPWILDWMYIPAMLCCDVKDGGSNPNTRPMEDYRAKQLAKEEAIEKLGTYNYIRLTDNNFGQLLSAFAELRMGDIVKDPDKHMFINEAAFTRFKDDFEHKKKVSLSDFKKVRIDNEVMKQYPDIAQSINNNQIKDTDVGYIWVTKSGKWVAKLYIDNHDYGDGKKWLALIEIANGYRGLGLGEQVLDYAIHQEGCSALGVHKNNKVAIDMYFKAGFKISPASKKKVDSGEDSYYHMYLGKIEEYDYDTKKESALLEMNISPEIKTAEELSDFMSKNIKYSDYTKLMSAEEVLKKKKGSCHDQVMFELEVLKKLGYKPEAVFFYEWSKDTGYAGTTHSFVTYKKDGKLYWFENSWEDMRGIHEYKSMQEIKDTIIKLHDEGKWGDNKKFTEVEFFPFRKHTPGESLQDFINICDGDTPANESALFEDSNFDALSVPFTKFKDNYKPEKVVSLDTFKKVPITDEIIKKYPVLKVYDDNARDTEIGNIWIDPKTDDWVAKLYTEQHEWGDYKKWVSDIEVNPKYQGCGIGKQLLEYAIHHEKCVGVAVNKDNKVAIDMYQKAGFKITPESRKEVENGENDYYAMYTESALLERVLFNEPDIYYNKDKFDSGEINLCFLTGHSGSGKTTMADNKKNDTTDIISLDVLGDSKDRFTMDEYKEQSDMIYSFFKGPGKKLYIGADEVDKMDNVDDYMFDLYRGFIDYAKKYAASHKDKKFIIEGIQIFWKRSFSDPTPMFNPVEFKDYAVYIKGTSAVVSKLRAAKRQFNGEKFEKLKSTGKFLFDFSFWKLYMADESVLKKFRDYYKMRVKEQEQKKKSVNETVGGMPSNRAHCDYIVPRMMSGLDFEDRSHIYFGNTGSDKILKFDAEGNPIFIDKKDVDAEIEVSPKIVLSSDNAFYFTEEELRSLGEDGLIEKLTGKEYHGMAELLIEKVVDISDTIDSDFLGVLITNGLVKNLQQVVLDHYVLKEELIDSKDNVIIYKDEDGYYMTTPNNVFVSPHYQNYVDISQDDIDLINHMYDEYIKRGGVINAVR